MVTAHRLRAADALRPLLIAAFLALGWLLLGAGNAHAAPAVPLSLEDAANPATSTVSFQRPADGLPTDALSTSALDTVAPTAPDVVEKVTARPVVAVVDASPPPLPATVAPVPVTPVTAPIAEAAPRLTSAAVHLAAPVEAVVQQVVEPIRQISQSVPSVVSDLPLKSEVPIVSSPTTRSAEHNEPAGSAHRPAAVKAERSLAPDAPSTHGLSLAAQPAFTNVMAWLGKVPLLTFGIPAPAVPSVPPCSPSSSPGLAPSGSGSQTGAFWLSDSTPWYSPALGTAIEISGQCLGSLSFEPGSSPD